VIWDFGGEPIDDHLVEGARRLATEGPPRALEGLLDDGECAALVARARRVAAKPKFPVDTTGRRYPWPLV
jgi:hypothetical protein